MTEIPEDLLANYTTAKRNPEWFYQTIARLIERIAKAEAQLPLLQWTAIEEGNLPKVGDELLSSGGIYPAGGENDWWVTEFNGDLEEYGKHWTHFRPINPPAPPTDKEQK